MLVDLRDDVLVLDALPVEVVVDVLLLDGVDDVDGISDVLQVVRKHDSVSLVQQHVLLEQVTLDLSYHASYRGVEVVLQEIVGPASHSLGYNCPPVATYLVGFDEDLLFLFAPVVT